MTHLRDARLKRALDEAPDADLRAPPRTRAAIQAAARDAVRPWWRRLWPAVGGRRGAPWSAALATVLLASLITLLWQGKEIPGARPEPVGADQAAPVSPAPAPAPALPAAERSAAAQRRATPAPAAVQAPAASRADVADAAEPAAAKRAREQAAGAALQRQAPSTMARSAAPAGALAGWQRWTQVRLEANGASVVVPRAQAGGLPALLARALRAQSAEPAIGDEVQLRLELSEGDEPVGALEWTAGGWRWLRDGLPARGLQLEPGLSQQLRDEAQRLLKQ